ncbi:MAG: hypothetical protein JXB47_05560 [Anaerolineae bacterium]|nr:hypothetical protein [Anaerolineae bacterium]
MHLYHRFVLAGLISAIALLGNLAAARAQDEISTPTLTPAPATPSGDIINGTVVITPTETPTPTFTYDPKLPTVTPTRTPLFGVPTATHTPTPAAVPTHIVMPVIEGTPDPSLPHLGYGIHVGPHTRIDPALVYNLNVDWVKLYDVPQLDDYPGLRVLYRMDIDPMPNLDAFRAEIIHRTQEVTAKGVDAIEVGNEPNLIIEWAPKPNPEEFTRYLCEAYRAIKSVAPGVIVVSGGLAPAPSLPDGSAINDLEFAQRMLDAGAGRCFDVFGYHPYGFNLPPEASPYEYEYGFRRAERVRKLLVGYGLGSKSIWMTEFGWLYAPSEEGVDCNGKPGFTGFEWIQLPKATVAEYVVRAIRYADVHWPWAGPMFLWNLDWQMYGEDYLPLCNQMRWFGLVDRNGNPNIIYQRYAAAPRRFNPRLTSAARASLSEVTLTTWTEDMTEIVEAYCPAEVRIGSFTVVNDGPDIGFEAVIEPVQGPGIPVTHTSRHTATHNDEVEVYIQTNTLKPGLHLVAINIVMFYDGRRMSTNVRGWVLAQPPTSPECVANAAGQ